ncbi:MAG: FKBP-type peptidyl-prolyl cis-trans isomerase [Ignavibacteria bacterium]|nr:FKBP-type peptidyl-prolyl cis-trans isomerase [Ignavibacteria bacterium]
MSIRLAVFALAAFVGCQQSGGQDVKLENTQDKISYSIGLNVGMSLMRDSIMVTPEAFLKGVLDAREDSSDRLLSEEDVNATLAAFQEEMRMKQADRAAKEGAQNQAAGAAFLSTNETLPGVVKLPSGLQYKIISAGTGPKPTASSTVEVHYTGRLIDGSVFDSSHKRGAPAVFPVNGVIKGWTEALQLMPVGSKWELYIPSDLGYGPGGSGVIPPNATLVFEVELLSIK